MQFEGLKFKLLFCVSVLSIAAVYAEDVGVSQEKMVAQKSDQEKNSASKQSTAHSPLKTLALHVNDLKKQVRELREQISQNQFVAHLEAIQGKISEIESNNQQDAIISAVNELVSQVVGVTEKVAEIENKASRRDLDESLDKVAREIAAVKGQIDGLNLKLMDPTMDNSIAYLAMQVKGVQGQVAQMNEDKMNGRDYDEHVTLSGREKSRNAPFYVFADLLYWKLEQGGMEYAVSFDYTSLQPSALLNAKSKELDFKYDYGYRIGIGYNTPYDGWDIRAAYTFFRTDTHDNHYGTFFPYLSYQGADLQSYAQNVKAHWAVKLKNLDVEIGNAFYLTKHLSMRPNIGIKAAKIEQNARVVYSNVFSGINLLGSAVVETENEFKGIGPRAGFDTCWHLGAGFSIVGNLNASLLAGWYDTEQIQTQFSVEQINLKNDFQRLAPTLEVFAGLCWDWYFHDDRFHLGFTAGYEAQYWWRQNQNEHFVDSLTPTYVRFSDDLSFSGLTAGVRFDF